MLLLTREEHCKLADVGVEAFKELQKRKRLPSVSPDPDRGYTPTATLLLILADELFRGMSLSRKKAAWIASRAWSPIEKRWKDVCETSAARCQGRNPAAEILYVWVDLAGRDDAVCGTFAEIANKYPRAVRFVGVNVTRAAAEMRMRAARAKIDLGNFFEAD